ncbi:MAG: chromate efflux transporter [Bacilli bacterium]|nr:chromate efflux transporter [Bacilli bacterium]
MILGGVAFVTPPLLMVLSFALLYVKYGELPAIFHVLYGIKPIIFSVILLALIRLWKKAINEKWMIGILLLIVALSFLGVHELIVMLIGGIVVLSIHLFQTKKVMSIAFPLFLLAADTETLRKIFLNFLKIGSILYGGGYVLLVFIESDFVERLGLISNAQLLDAIAVGQLTPGPLFTTATFIGYILGGVTGALLGTLGIFLPSFLFVGLLHKFLPVMQKNVYLRQFLNGVIIASLGLMIVVLYYMFSSAVTDILTMIVMIASFIMLYKYKINPAYLVVIGGLIGYIVHLF